jgi:hypothetical protein
VLRSLLAKTFVLLQQPRLLCTTPSHDRSPMHFPRLCCTDLVSSLGHLHTQQLQLTGILQGIANNAGVVVSVTWFYPAVKTPSKTLAAQVEAFVRSQ